MNVKILYGAQCENIEQVNLLFDEFDIIAQDTSDAIFKRIRDQIVVPALFLQDFVMIDTGYLYYYRNEECLKHITENLLRQLYTIEYQISHNGG